MRVFISIENGQSNMPHCITIKEGKKVVMNKNSLFDYITHNGCCPNDDWKQISKNNVI